MTKPLPLKQRTSSLDTRRDYSAQTWWSVLDLLKLREYVITVDHFSIWRRHLAWAMKDGKELKTYMTQRYASSMVFMSLLLSAELGALFNSAGITTEMRHQLQLENFYSISFWIGVTIIISIILTLLSLLSTFTAWAMVSAVDVANAHCIFRSSIGQYVAELPGRFIVCSIYSFIAWVTMFIFVLLPFGFFSLALLFGALTLFVNVITAFSALGRIIMHTGAMGSQRIFDPSYERILMPHGLHTQLLAKAKANLANRRSITRQYRADKPLDRHYSDEELTDHLSDRTDPDLSSLFDLSSDRTDPERPSLYDTDDSSPNNSNSCSPARPKPRRESSVRFADQVFTDQSWEGTFPTPASQWPRLAKMNQPSESSSAESSTETRAANEKKSPDPTSRPPAKPSNLSESKGSKSSENTFPRSSLSRSRSSSRVVSPLSEGSVAESTSGGQDLPPPPRPGLLSSKSRPPLAVNGNSAATDLDGIQKWLQASPSPIQPNVSPWTTPSPPSSVVSRISPTGTAEEAMNTFHEQLSFDAGYGDSSGTSASSKIDGCVPHKTNKTSINSLNETASLLANDNLKNEGYV